jgi:hypothetical protein
MHPVLNTKYFWGNSVPKLEPVGKRVLLELIYIQRRARPPSTSVCDSSSLAYLDYRLFVVPYTVKEQGCAGRMHLLQSGMLVTTYCDGGSRRAVAVELNKANVYVKYAAI